MGGEGYMMAANNSLKNNRSLLSKRKEKKAFEGSYSNIKLKEFPKASKVELLRIQEKIKAENKLIRKKQYIIFTIVFIILFLMVSIYLKL